MEGGGEAGPDRKILTGPRYTLPLETGQVEIFIEQNSEPHSEGGAGRS